MPAPRPILKGLPSSFLSPEAASNPLPFSSCSRILDSPHVHFPPTPILTSTATTHSSYSYDRAPIVVSPNVCALPERGSRKFIGSNGNQGGLGYFHPHAKFQVDPERDFSETVSPALFSASVAVGINHCGSVGLFHVREKLSGPVHQFDYDYEYDQYSSHDQHTQHAQHVISSLTLDPSSEPLDLSAFRLPPAPCAPITSSSLPSTSSSLNVSPRNMYDSLTPPSPTSTASNNNSTVSLFDKHQHRKKNSESLDGGKNFKKRRNSREYTRYRAETMGWTQWTMSRPGESDGGESDLEGCLGGF